MPRTAARIMLDAELVWTRYTYSLSKCLTLLALLTAFIAMSFGALHNTCDVSDDRDEGMKSARVRSKSTPHPTFSHSMQEFIHKTF